MEVENDARLADLVVWRVDGGAPIAAAFALCGALRGALYAKLGRARLPEDLHHSPKGADSHISYLVEAVDDDGAIARVMAHAPTGFTRPALIALLQVTELRYAFRGGGRVSPVVPIYVGHRPSPEMAPSTPWGMSARWRSLTPFVSPLHVAGRSRQPRERYHPGEQAARLLTDIGLPGPVRIMALDTLPLGRATVTPTSFQAEDFVRRKKESTERPPIGSTPLLLELWFAEPVAGPIAIGYGAHFGLGQFLPTHSATAE